MKHLIGKKVLVTCDDWFIGRDGKHYRCIHGTLKNVHEFKQVFGFSPGARHANYTFEIGEMVIAGCRINYIEAVDKVEFGKVYDFYHDTNQMERRPSPIYKLS